MSSSHVVFKYRLYGQYFVKYWVEFHKKPEMAVPNPDSCITRGNQVIFAAILLRTTAGGIEPPSAIKPTAVL